MGWQSVVKFFQENYDKGILGGICIWVFGKITKYVNPKIKKLIQITHSVDRILKLETDVDLIEEENFILRAILISIVKTAIYPMYMLDENSDLILVNDAWLKITGYNNPEDAYGSGYISSICEEDKDEMEDIARQRLHHAFASHGKVGFVNRIVVCKNSKN